MRTPSLVRRTRSAWIGLFVAIGLLFSSAAVANDGLLQMQDQPSDFVMPNANYFGQNYSPLDQIDTDNVGDMRVEWTFQTGVNDSHEGQVLVIDDTMYFLTPKPNVLYALDLTRDGVVKWSFAPDMPDLEQAIAAACCGAQSRGVSYADGKLVFNTLDGQLFGVQAEDGEVLWRTEVINLDINETTTTAPLIVHNHAIIGVAGGEYGVRGWVAAYDLDTGEEVWKMYSTGPNDEMGITDRFQPFYEVDQTDEPGLDSWFGDSWQTGGGTVWGWWSYDPELDMFYYSTGNCGPWNPDYRRDPATAPDFETYGSKYCAALMARDATTGELIWAYSLTPQDQWDLDEPGTNVLADIEIDGEERAVLIKPARNGFFYTFDRATGEILNDPWAFAPVNWAHSVDPATGMPDFNMDKVMYTDVPVDNVCPYIGARNWENDAFSPDTGLIYFTALNRCGDYTAIEGDYRPGESYILFDFRGSYPSEDVDWTRRVMAVDPATDEVVWAEEQTGHYGNSWSKPIFTTGGNLMFQGTEEGLFVARDATSGERLWEFRTGTDFRNTASTYIGPDGRQYVVMIGSGAPVNANVAVDDDEDAGGRYRRSSATVYVFSVPNQ